MTKRSLLPLALVAATSVAVALIGAVDLFVPKPYDGISPAYSPDSGEGIVVERVVADSAADRAGILPGDRILGIGEELVETPSDAARELVRHKIGETVKYLVERDHKLEIIDVEPGASLRASPFYVYDAALGFLFFLLGLLVLMQRTDDEAARVYFLLCDLFLVFLVCRFRPASYYWVDFFEERAGAIALFLLPAVFLHFFLIFPARKRFTSPGEDASPLRRTIDRWLNQRKILFGVIYAIPPLAYFASLYLGTADRQAYFGAPAVNWLILGNYFLAGLLALGHSWLAAEEPGRRRQLLPVLVGSVLGTAPLIVFGVLVPALTHETRFVLYGTLPLILIPMTFGYAIFRYQLLNVRLVVRKGLLYAVTTALVTGIYALAIATANQLLGEIEGSTTVAFVLAVVVVLLFDPMRRKIQAPIDRLFFRDRVDFARAVHEMSEDLRAELSLDRIEEILTGRVVTVTHAGGAWLFLTDSERVLRSSPPPKGPSQPLRLDCDSALARELRERPRPVRIDGLLRQGLDQPSVALARAAADGGMRLAVPLAYEERLLGILFLERKLSEEDYSKEELELLATLANQAAVALETARLHRERTLQVELERDLEIAREIQQSLFPSTLPAPPGFSIAARSIPARVVGGDFYDAFPIGADGDDALGIMLGDVSGKSIPGALLMVASREILYACARQERSPSLVFRDASRRIYSIKRRMFVALGYYVLDASNLELSYSIAGMPTPLLCRAGEGKAVPLPAPANRIPLGGLREVPYDDTSISLAHGDLILFYSDGFTEALDPTGEQYGEERLEARIWELRERPLDEIGDHLVEDVRRFAASAEPYDDMTFLLLRVEVPPA